MSETTSTRRTRTKPADAKKKTGTVPVKDRVLGWMMVAAASLACMISQTPFAYEAVKSPSSGNYGFTMFAYVATALALIGSATLLAHSAMAYANELFEKHTITKK